MARQLGASAQIQFQPDPVPVGLDGLAAQVQLRSDFIRAQALTDQLEDLQLAVREGFDGETSTRSPPPPTARHSSRSAIRSLRYTFPSRMRRMAPRIVRVASCLLT